MIYYGTKNNRDYGFYEQNFEGALEITEEYWTHLLNEQNNGKIIIPFENSVIAVDDTEYSFCDNKWVKLSKEEAELKQLNIQNAIRANEIRNKLDDLDRKRVRAIAEPSLMDENTTWLEYYNTKISELRDELATIS